MNQQELMNRVQPAFVWNPRKTKETCQGLSFDIDVGLRKIVEISSVIKNVCDSLKRGELGHLDIKS